MWVAGAADGSVKVWDRRHLKDAVHTFKLHDSAIMRVEWAPYKKGATGPASLLFNLTSSASSSCLERRHVACVRCNGARQNYWTTESWQLCEKAPLHLPSLTVPTRI